MKQINRWLCVMSTVLVCVSAQADTLKAVMQLNSGSLDVVLRGIRNAIEISEEAGRQSVLLDLKVVISGPAVDQFEKGMSPDLANTFQELLKFKDVHSFICGRTLNKIHKDMKELLPGLAKVSSGAFEVLLLERQGYFYIKP